MDYSKKFKLMPWLLVLLPTWLIVSACLALVKYFKDEDNEKLAAQARFSRAVSIPALADDLRKIIDVIGERNTTKPENLRAISSMIQGSLGPANTGYEIKSIIGPATFPILQVSISGSDPKSPPIWILTSYDSPNGSRGAEKNASGLTATLATAQALANSTPIRTIHFVFIPHINEADSPILETASTVLNLINTSRGTVLCIEAMAYAETLILTSRDASVLPTKEFTDLGEILGAEVTCLGDDFDLASTLFESGLPAMRLATRPTLLPDEPDDKLPFAPTLAASTGRLIEFIRRLSE